MKWVDEPAQVWVVATKRTDGREWRRVGGGDAWTTVGVSLDVSNRGVGNASRATLPVTQEWGRPDVIRGGLEIPAFNRHISQASPWVLKPLP